MTFNTVRGSDLRDSHIICRDSLTLNAGYLLNLARVVVSQFLGADVKAIKSIHAQGIKRSARATSM